MIEWPQSGAKNVIRTRKLPCRGYKGTEIPETWEVTSDSLAAWLACELHAARLLLVKSAEPPPGPVGVDELARQGLVDPAFPRFLAACGVEAWCLGPGHPERLASCDRSGSRITA